MTDREIFYRHLGLPSFNAMDLEIVKADGIWFYDRTGKKFMDLVSGITVSNVGHRHPKVIQAISEQTDKYLHLNVYGEFIQSPQVKLAKKLVSLLPETLSNVFFVNSGSEAIEGALKLAKRDTGRSGIISFSNAYHGSTHGCLSITGNESLKNAYRPLLPGIRQIEFNNISHLEAITSDTACVVLETVQAEAGIVSIHQEFIDCLVKRCRDLKVLILLDDIQMGLGRTGKMFSFEHFGFIPDILALAKALGAGMPLGAFISSKEIMKTLAYNPELGHITTFGGHPVSCAAAIAGLDVLLSENLLGQVEGKGSILEEKLGHHPGFSAVRRAGLALGIDLKNPDKKEHFMRSAIGHGAIIDWYMFRPATFRIAPPLTITPDELEEACQRILAAADESLE